MPLFRVIQTDIYEIEAENLEEAQIYWRNELLTGFSDESEFIEGSTIYKEKGE